MRRHQCKFFVAILLSFALIQIFAAPEPNSKTNPKGLGVSPDGVLLLKGTPYRGIGVNYFNAFMRTLNVEAVTSYEEGFKTLARHKIPFARFAATGFWPVEMQLYQTNKTAYFARLDAVVKCAETNGVGLIPSLFWNLSLVPDLVGEPCDQWGNPKSKTHEWMRTYTREVVRRYKTSPAIWGWEFGNEYNLAKDLPNAAEHRRPTAVRLGTPAERTVRDELTHEMIVTALSEFAREVRRHDPDRFITSGNSMPRPAAWHMREERKWTVDTPEQFAGMLAAEHPDPLNVMSIHAYRENFARIPLAGETAAKLRKPLFVGEFQIDETTGPDSRERFDAVLKMMQTNNVALAAVWVFDYARQEDQFNVTRDNSRAWQLNAISNANQEVIVSNKLGPRKRSTPGATKADSKETN